MKNRPRYNTPIVHSFSQEEVRELLGPVTCQYQTTTVVLPSLPAENGSVANVPPIPPVPVPIVATIGDGLKIPPIIGPDALSQGFLSFNISGIPATAVITAADIALTPIAPQVIGAPFTDLGPLVIAEFDYGALDATDFGVLGGPIGSATSFPVTQSAITAVQIAVSTPLPRFRVTLYFGSPTTTDGNNDLDQAIITPADAVLTVTYQ